MEELETAPNYTHCQVPADSIELAGNERPMVSLDGTQWVIRRAMVEGDCVCLTLEDVKALHSNPLWSVQEK